MSPPYLNIHADWTPTGSLDGVFVSAEHPTSAEYKGGSTPPRVTLLLLYATSGDFGGTPLHAQKTGPSALNDPILQPSRPGPGVSGPHFTTYPAYRATIGLNSSQNRLLRL